MPFNIFATKRLVLCRRSYFPSIRKVFFSPSRASHFCRDKSNQNRLPRHPALRFAPGALTPSSLQGHASKGHPWPIVALAASLPLNPFHNDSVHPPEGALARLMLLCGEMDRAFRRLGAKTPSEGRVEVVRRGVSRKDAARGITGQGWPVYAGPRSGTGRRAPEAKRRAGCRGAFSLVTFSLRVQRESNSPGGAKQKMASYSENSCTYKVPDQAGTKTLKGMAFKSRNHARLWPSRRSEVKTTA